MAHPIKFLGPLVAYDLSGWYKPEDVLDRAMDLTGEHADKGDPLS